MTTTNKVKLAAPSDAQAACHGEVLNAFAIANGEQLRWKANIYRFKPLRGKPEEPRKAIREAAWAARKAHGSLCSGYSFVVEIDDERVAVSPNWKFLEGLRVNDFEVSLQEVVEIDASNRRFTPAFARIIKDGIKTHFKENAAAILGPLWQDFNSFCETPTGKDDITKAGFIFCRRFDFDAKETVAGWCVKFNVSTASIDAASIKSYYENRNVEELAARITAKLENRSNRKGEPVAIRIWHATHLNGRMEGKVYELASPSQILDDADLPPAEQAKRAALELPCKDFPKGQIHLDSKRCFLLLDSSITREEHDETIIEPSERLDLAQKLRDFVNGCSVHGVKLDLLPIPVSASAFPVFYITPPPVYVRDSKGTRIVGRIADLAPAALQGRARERQEHIRRYGFYESQHINPVLAVPRFLGQQRADDLLDLLNSMMERRGINYRFSGPLCYDNVNDIERAVSRGNHDSLFAVLNERWNQPQNDYSTHEQIKQRIPVPSQCVHHYNVFYRRQKDVRLKDLANCDKGLARRIENQLDLCVANLLVKCHWFPFLPAAGFHYDAHLAFDVGGKRDDRVMACFGMGFCKPENGLILKPHEIPLHGKQAEPVDPDALFNGFVHLFETMQADLKEDGRKLNLDSLLIIRDGPLLGAGDKWNEQDALVRLYQEALDRGWAARSATWTAMEIMKAAEGWRVMNIGDSISNPTVGFACFPFLDPSEGLVCTTGLPYLHQGTAAPLKVRLIDIAGKAVQEAAIRDLVWEADMCFTKPDMGLSLPLLLQIADSGALQLSKRYKISGVTL